MSSLTGSQFLSLGSTESAIEMTKTDQVLAHMNKDHQLALLDYIVVYGNIRSQDIVKSSVKLTLVDKEKMTINYNIKRSNALQTLELEWRNAIEPNYIVVSKPGDIRPKLISMAKYAAAKQGYSHIQLKRAIPPKGAILMYFLFIFLAASAWDYKKVKQWLASDPLLSRIAPYLPLLLYNFIDSMNKRLVFFVTYGIHIFEATCIMFPRTIRYRLPLSKKIAWCTMNFFEGFFTLLRFRAYSEAQQ